MIKNLAQILAKLDDQLRAQLSDQLRQNRDQLRAQIVVSIADEKE